MNTEKNEKNQKLEITDLNPITFELSDDDMEAIGEEQTVKISAGASSVSFVACNSAFVACNSPWQ
jgi:hypothetical protein